MTDYQQRLIKVIDYIGHHLDESLSLEILSKIFHVSKFHFHRLFTAFTGLSLHQYIKWLRLKRAAHQLMVSQDQSIIKIAIDAGFESHEAFSRAFKKACGVTPTQYRRSQNGFLWERLPYRLPTQGNKHMKVEIRKVNQIRLASIEHRGDPSGVTKSVNELVSWVKTQSINLKPKAGEAFAIAYDDPQTTPSSEFRLDLGIRIPENFKLEGKISEKYLPAGRYAVAVHKGSRHNLSGTVYSLYRDWLVGSGEELGDFPCVLCYCNFDHEVAETELVTECWILLK